MIRLEKNGATAEISPLGAEMRVYRTPDGKDRLWNGNPDVWAGVSPVLYPIIGALKNQVVRIGGQEYATPRHGFARTMPFQLVEQEPDSCAFMLEDTPDTRKAYPFAFRLTVRHRLLDNGFSTEFEVENAGKIKCSGENTLNAKMPFVIGGHPGFTCPMNEGEAFSDYRVVFEKEEQGRSMLCTPDGLLDGTEIVPLGADCRTLALDYPSFDQKDTYVFAGLNSRSVKLVHKDTGKGLRFSFPNSPVLAIWTKPDANAPYVCLEPWNGLPALVDETGDFEDKPYHIVLAPGKSFRVEYRMEII